MGLLAGEGHVRLRFKEEKKKTKNKFVRIIMKV